MQQTLLYEMIAQNKTTCAFAFNGVNHQTQGLRLNAQAASAGFIYRHVGETMLLFGYFFGLPATVPNTTMGQVDTGQGTDVEASARLVADGYAMLETIVATTPGDGWLAPVDTPFFGTVSRMRLFAHVLYHNAHHAGQIALTLSKAHPANA